MANVLVWDGVFARRMENKDWVIAKYEAHNRAVPEEEYPRVNSTDEFKVQWEQIARQARSQSQVQQ